MPALVPELSVSDFPAALAFYLRLGWAVVHARPEDEFALLRLGEAPEAAEVMLDGMRTGRNFDADLTAADRPFGRGLNLEITVPALAPVLAAMGDHPLALPVEEMWYRAGAVEIGVRQFIVADPEGCLLRFSEPQGTRPCAGPAAEGGHAL
ncbi:bleomycin resistance family protein [Paracoccus sanguinis]|uniref:bleomycin resistance family protein n=1 Tax=Paracoccus sanguinis TaxID=1545044 RepID=UPI00051FD9C7|nr:bleomycin resistance family protein [Paracoccus sanguinis]KGJ21341.1 hypothetical protein IX55_02465 [Paracoccus sanguinis]QJD15834.1 bleomycin resistance family protein [Paracoccus sanguinis]